MICTTQDVSGATQQSHHHHPVRESISGRTLVLIIALLLGCGGGAGAVGMYFRADKDQPQSQPPQQQSQQQYYPNLGLSERQESQVKDIVGDLKQNQRAMSDDMAGLREQVADLKQSVTRIEALLERDRR